MTNAWLQRFISLGGLMAWWALAIWLWDTERGWAVLCLAAALLIKPVLLGIQCIWAALVNRHETQVQPANLSQWLGAWLAEWKAATLVFTWWQPFRHHAVANNLQSQKGQRGIVLIHGFFCNRALWTEWMIQLNAQQRAFVAVDLEPAFGSISEYADTVEAAIAQVTSATGLPPVVVGHSMGGLAIRAWAEKYIGPAGHMGRVHHIFTLGTPHHGTAMAVALPTRNAAQMRQASAWHERNLAQLPAYFAAHCTCYFSHCDNIVIPASTATLAGADNRHMQGYAHVQLVFSRDIQQACLASLS
jgi:triacylglycerol lipase